MQGSQDMTASAFRRMLPEGVVISPWSRRLGAALLDGLLAIVTLGIGWAIWLIFTCQTGQTPAKKILGMRIVSTETGKALSPLLTFLREFFVKGLVGSITIGIAYLWILFDPDNQALYDKIMTANVVNDPQGLTLNTPA